MSKNLGSAIGCKALARGTGGGMRNYASGNDIITKVYPTDIIPDKIRMM